MTYKWHATRPLTATAARDFWEKRYEHGVTPWDRGGVSPALDTWLGQGAVPTGRVLVPGCGRGYEVVELARKGYEVVGLDISAAAVRFVRAELERAGLDAQVLEADLFRWEPDRPFDAVYDQTCLCALLPEQWAAYAGRLARWIKRGGRLCVLFMQTNRSGGPPFHCDLDAMRRLFRADDWEWPRSEPLEAVHSSGFLELGYILIRR